MRIHQISDKMNRYIDNTMEIRKLSSPDIEKIGGADEYVQVSRVNALKIRKLSEENREIMKKVISPLLTNHLLLSDELGRAFNDFCEKLIDVYDMVDVDLPILMRVSERLLEDARGKDDPDYLVKQLDRNVIANYAMMNQFKRSTLDSHVWKKYHENGLKAADEILSFMDEKCFLKLHEEESRESVLITTRYFCTLYDNKETTAVEAEMIFRKLTVSYELAENPFYHEQAPNYDWNRHRIKALEYMGQLTENNNQKACSRELCSKIRPYLSTLLEIFDENPEQNKQYISRYSIQLLQIRTDYFAGMTDRESYKVQLAQLYEEWALEHNPVYAIYCYDLLPLEYVGILDRAFLTEQEKGQLDKFYHNAISFAMYNESNVSLSFFLEYFIQLLDTFIELPDCTHFDTLVLRCFAALHPPSYIHAFMTAKLAGCLCTHLITICPNLFLGIFGCYSVEQIKTKKDSIIHFTYHAALMHDVGKLAMIETLLTCGRDLTEEEKQILSGHPQLGCHLVQDKKSVEQYKNVILSHHEWYDDPTMSDKGRVQEKTVIDLVTCASELARATEYLGDQAAVETGLKCAMKEIEKESGKRYGNFFPWFFKLPEVVADIQYLITEGRTQLYRETYIRAHEIATGREQTFF